MTHSDLWTRLAEPFPADAVSWRVGSVNATSKRGMALAYLDARDVMDRLDAVCGPAGWQNRYPHANGKTVCEIGVRVGDDWVWKSDGAGDSDVEAEKGALSDAFKRAAVRFGIGRYLYSLPAPWVQVEPMGKSWKIADGEIVRLQQLLNGNAKAVTNSPKTMALKKSVSALMDGIRSCGSEDELEDLLAHAETKELRADCARLIPGWSSSNEFEGLEGLITRTRAEFKRGPQKGAYAARTRSSSDESGPPPGHPAADPFGI